MTAITSTAYSRDLGDELRRLREKFTGLTGHAFVLAFSVSAWRAFVVSVA
ncbi:hypothetical protein [Lentzea albidocapillata]|nr:hypothetical protein [Lentzea albidocapillata]